MQMRKYLEMDYDDINNSRYMFLLAEEHAALDWLFEPVMRALNVPTFSAMVDFSWPVTMVQLTDKTLTLFVFLKCNARV